MKNKITGVIIGNPQWSGSEYKDLNDWLGAIRDSRWQESWHIEDGFEIYYFDDDRNIIHKLNEACGFDVIVCLTDYNTFETQFPNIVKLNNKYVNNKIIKMPCQSSPGEIGEQILNKFYCNMETFTDNKECFTVYTPCFNTPYNDFMRLYNSLCNQTYGSWEWYILDDSNDGVGIENYVNEVNDFRIRCIKNITNHGNVGYNKRILSMSAINEYLLEVDHDDELTPNCLEKIHEAFIKYPECGFCYSNCLEIGENNRPIIYGDGWGLGQGDTITMPVYGAHQEVNWQCSINEASIRHIVSAPNHIRCWRSNVYRKIYGHNYNYSIADDYEIVVRTFLETEMCFIEDYLYIQHEEKPTTQRHRNREIQRCVECIKQLYDKRIHERILELGYRDTIWDERAGCCNFDLINGKCDQIMNKVLK
jgi:hypothetical protein